MIKNLIERDTCKTRHTFISLFSGAGGMDIGFYKAGFEPVWANDIDADAVATYKKLFDTKHIQQGDIRKQSIPEDISPSIVIGGPPCQGFSVAGKMDPDDPRSKHVWDFLGIVKLTQPSIFVMENVKALAVNKRWSGLREQLDVEVRKMGYEPQIWLLNAAHYNVPQARERMFLIGKKIGNDKIRTPVQPNPVTADKMPTVKEYIQKLPAFGEAGNNSICNAKITLAKKPVLRKSPYAGMLFNGQGRPVRLDAPIQTLPATMGGNRTPIIDQHQLINESESWVEYYHSCILKGSKIPTVPSASLRRLTVEEAAILQTFPTGMEFMGRQSSKFRQIGNAVPPNLSYHVAKSIMEALD